MRAAVACALVGFTSLATPDGSRRYLVIPTGHVVDTGAHPCRPSLSADGRVVAFDASAALDPSDQNGRTDVYVLDRGDHQDHAGVAEPVRSRGPWHEPLSEPLGRRPTGGLRVRCE